MSNATPLRDHLMSLCYHAALRCILERDYIVKIAEAYGEDRARSAAHSVANAYAEMGVKWMEETYIPNNPDVDLSKIQVGMDPVTMQVMVEGGSAVVDELCGMFSGMMNEEQH